ncbi:hypothetical protein ACRRTK_012977 [Alexandromys fortis]
MVSNKKLLTLRDCELMEILIRNAHCIISTVAYELEHLEVFSGKQLWAWALTLLSPKGVTAGEDRKADHADAHSSSPWVVWLPACGPGIQSLENVGIEFSDTQPLPSLGLCRGLSACSSARVPGCKGACWLMTFTLSPLGR